MVVAVVGKNMKLINNFFKKYLLFSTLFITGASILIVEIVALRILSPYYGNTIFTASSVIGIILAALSLGYYIGGISVDRKPSLKVFFGIILVGGIAVMFIQILTVILLPGLGYALPITFGPLISAILLFFLPSFLLGMLSPFAIKLQKLQTPKQGIGSVAGKVFFWSTLGSIFGSLFAGFVLIPHFGINQIIIAIGILLVIVGLIPLIYLGLKKGTIIKIILGIIILVIFVSLSQISLFQGNKIYIEDGIYEKIVIYDDKYEDRDTRFFLQDRSISGAMFLDNPNELVFDYTKYYSLYQVFNPDIKNALIIGGGIYSMPKALLAELPLVEVDVAEIEPSLLDLGKKYFEVPDNPRLKNYVEDGRRLLHDTDKKYDLIFSDVYYSLFSVPTHFTTEEFFQIARNGLNKNGIFIANLIGSLSRQGSSLVFSEIKTFKEVFPNSYFFAVNSPKLLDLQNIIFVGYNSDKKISFTDSMIKGSENEIIRNLDEKLIDLNRFELSVYPKFNDNFAPVDYLTAKVVSQIHDRERTMDGNEMMALIAQQLRYGPRFLSAEGHDKIQKFLISELSVFTSNIHIQKWKHVAQDGEEYKLMNIIGQFYPEKEKRILLGTHYDSKRFADRDIKNPQQSVPGANDSASGVAVLIELARFLAIAEKEPNVGIDIVFFDGEEGEEHIRDDYSKWQPLGSTYFSQNLEDIYQDKKPTEGIVLDMVCDKNLYIYPESLSLIYAPEQVKKFWDKAIKNYPSKFSTKKSFKIKDDHVPLSNAGIPSFLVIDFNYKSFHTTRDTLDKCSGKSLEIVGKTVLNYLYNI